MFGNFPKLGVKIVGVTSEQALEGLRSAAKPFSYEKRHSGLPVPQQGRVERIEDALELFLRDDEAFDKRVAESLERLQKKQQRNRVDLVNMASGGVDAKTLAGNIESAFAPKEALDEAIKQAVSEYEGATGTVIDCLVMNPDGVIRVDSA